eukprot:TRINITY_DN30844_c0_g1_i1.p1 TRINITY_DN30844_c0_g1~~TRINITY_DN30844_c0_g1_i1.p1  ORF type:complete len:580 (-),score=76.33 TRINITY_DN30844_c0_g1_i1:191-1894(-)
MSVSRENNVSLRAKVDAPGPPEQCVVTGSIEALGLWNPRSGLVLHWRGGAWVTKEPLLLAAGIYVEFKFVRLRYGFVDWEPGCNRTMQVPLSGELALEGRFGGDSMLTVLESQPQVPVIAEARTEPPVDARPSDSQRFEAVSLSRYEEMASQLMAQHKALELRQRQQESLLAQQAQDTERLRAELQEARLESARLAQEAEQSKSVFKTGAAMWGWKASSGAIACQPREASVPSELVLGTGSWEGSPTANVCCQVGPKSPTTTCAPASCGSETPNKATTCQSLETRLASASPSSVESMRPSVGMDSQSELGEEEVANTYTNLADETSARVIYTPGGKAPVGCEAPDVKALPSPFFSSSPTTPSLAKSSTAASTPPTSSGCPKKTDGRLLHGGAGKGHLWGSRSSLPTPHQGVLSSPMRSFRDIRAGFWQTPRVAGYGRSQALAAPLSANSSSSSFRKARSQHFAYDVAAGPGKDATSVRAEPCPQRASDDQKTPSREATIAALLAARGASPVMIRTPDEPCEMSEMRQDDWQREGPGLLMSKEVEAAFSNARLRFSQRLHKTTSRQSP